MEKRRLSAVEERSLLKRARDGDVSAKERLVKAYEGLIGYVVRRFQGLSDRDDLMQSGMIGLLTAIDRFDMRRKVRLSTFALPHILGEVRRHCQKDGTEQIQMEPADAEIDLSQVMDRLIVRDALRRLSLVERKLVLWRYFYERSQTETASELGMSQAQVSRIEKGVRQQVAVFLTDDDGDCG